MTHHTLNYPDKHPAYPGEYITSPHSFEELLDELQQPHEGEAIPLVNIMEMPDFFSIEMAAPGLKRGGFDVSINHNILTISFLNKDIENNQKLYRQHEFNYRCFKRDIVVPGNIDPDFISVAYADGILNVNLPKSIKPFIHRVDRIIVY